MSTLEVSNLNDGTTTVATTFVTNGSAKVWTNFNGTGTAAINASLNASSLVDNAIGQFTINFTNSFSSTYYSFTLGGGNGRVGGNNVQSGGPRSWGGAPAASSLSFSCTHHTGSEYNPADATLTINGDLA
jgi:hypothetical protein